MSYRLYHFFLLPKFALVYYITYFVYYLRIKILAVDTVKCYILVLLSFTFMYHIHTLFIVRRTVKLFLSKKNKFSYMKANYPIKILEIVFLVVFPLA